MAINHSATFSRDDMRMMFQRLLSQIFTAQSWMYLWPSLRLRGQEVGRDSFGNRYVELPSRVDGRPARRHVVYAQTPEASAVPPEWHAWLHHQVVDAPSSSNPFRRQWQQDHEPNQTGQASAYVPSGHATRVAKRADATGDYQAWSPKG